MRTQKILIALSFLTFTALFNHLSAQAGTISWTLNREANPTQDQNDAYQRITAAMNSATEYYNKYTTLTKHLNVYYNTGVQTADASFNGTIRFGSNRSYMVVHTAMHEIAHTIGIGTTSEYRNLIKNGLFTGTHATKTLREITNDNTAVLHGDNTHFWPYGLNYASEVTGEKDLINHCYIVNAIYQDLFHESLFAVCRLRSKSSGKIVYVQQDELFLGNRVDSSSIVKLVMLNDTNTFRLEFGSKVLDIPNESKSAGIQVKLWDWNGGDHQKAYFEFQSKNIVRIKMVHSGLYLRAVGEKIFQDYASSTDESQYWEILQLDNTTVKGIVKHTASSFMPISIKMNKNRINLYQSNTANLPVKITILDLQGRIQQSRILYNVTSFSISNIVPGTYIARVQAGDQISYSNFVINNSR